MDLQKFVADGGLKSRKLWFGVGCILVLVAVVLVACHYAAAVGLYSQFVTGVVSLYGIYCGVDGVRHWGNVKHLADKLTDEPDDDKAAK